MKLKEENIARRGVRRNTHSKWRQRMMIQWDEDKNEKDTDDFVNNMWNERVDIILTDEGWR